MKRLPALLPAVAYALGIVVLSHIPGLRPPGNLSWTDKLVHIILYTGFGLTLVRALSAWIPWDRFGAIALWTVLIGALYAASDELHQLFVPYRVADFLDWVADVVGIGASLLIARLLSRNWSR